MAYLPVSSAFCTSASVCWSEAGSATLYLYSKSTIHCVVSTPPMVSNTALPLGSMNWAPFWVNIKHTQSQIRASDWTHDQVVPQMPFLVVACAWASSSSRVVGGALKPASESSLEL